MHKNSPISYPLENEKSRFGQIFFLALKWALGFALLLTFIRYLKFISVEGDTVVLVKEVNEMLKSIQHGQWLGWGGQFPLLQKIPVIIFKLCGFSDTWILPGLAWLNLTAFILMLVWSYKKLCKELPRAAAVFLVVLLSGPMLWYAKSSFGEMLAALVTLAFIISCRENSHPMKIFLFSVLAGISKETAFPFILLLGLLGTALHNPAWDRTSWQLLRWKSILAGCVVTICLNIGFNYLRFKSIFNLAYLTCLPYIKMLSWKGQLSFFLGIWFSPNGGVGPFWLTWFFLWLLLGWWVSRKVLFGARPFQERIRFSVPYILTAAVLGGLTLGFSRWVSPLGWDCWGPRFMIPWLPAVGYILVVAYGSRWERFFSQLLKPFWKFLIISAVFVLVTLPQYIILFKPDELNWLCAPDEKFPLPAIIQRGGVYYFQCIHYRLWQKKSMLLNTYSVGHMPLFYALIICAALLWFLYANLKKENEG
jgi:hypothetical protein